jgi:hypothetical protein
MAASELVPERATMLDRIGALFSLLEEVKARKLVSLELYRQQAFRLRMAKAAIRHKRQS